MYYLNTFEFAYLVKNIIQAQDLRGPKIRKQNVS